MDARGGNPDDFFPPTETSPVSGASKPDSRESSVVFPDPLLPIMETNSPWSTDRFTFSRTWRVFLSERNVFERFRDSRNAKSAPFLQADLKRDSTKHIMRSKTKPTTPIVTMHSRMCA